MLTIFVRAVLLFLLSVLAMRVMGKRQVGQLQPFELVVVIMIAELATTPMGDVGTPLLDGVLPMLALIVCHGLLTGAAMRWEHFRAWLCGRPAVLIQHGAICETELRKTAMTLSDLMALLRIGGVQDVAQVETAVLETGGQMSVFPKAADRPLTPGDMSLSVAREGLPLPLIMDGRVQQHNLRRGGLTESWLKKMLHSLGYTSPGEVFFLCVNASGKLLCQGRGKAEMQELQALERGKVGW